MSTPRSSARAPPTDLVTTGSFETTSAPSPNSTIRSTAAGAAAPSDTQLPSARGATPRVPTAPAQRPSTSGAVVVTRGSGAIRNAGGKASPPELSPIVLTMTEPIVQKPPPPIAQIELTGSSPLARSVVQNTASSHMDSGGAGRSSSASSPHQNSGRSPVSARSKHSSNQKLAGSLTGRPMTSSSASALGASPREGSHHGSSSVVRRRLSPRGVMRQKLVDAGLKEASLEAKLAHFDALCQAAAAQGDWRAAQGHLDDLRLCSTTEGERMIKEVKVRASALSSRGKLREELASELRAFSTMWEAKLEDFDEQAAKALEEQRLAHAKHMEAEEDILRASLVQRKPHFSKHVMRTREALKNLIDTKHFGEADIVQRTLQSLESKELAKFHDTVSATFAQKTKQMHEAALKATAALKQRIDTARKTLLAQRKDDFMTLLQRQENKRSELEDSERRRLTRQVRNMQKKIAVASAGGTLSLREALPGDDA